MFTGRHFLSLDFRSLRHCQVNEGRPRVSGISGSVHPLVSRGKWKVEWKEDKDFERRLSSPTESTGTAGVISGNDQCAVRPAGETP